MAALPSGTVTFLFTAIEGSTTRREQHREQMQAALARHDRLLRQAIAAHGGRVFKTVGDAFSVTWGTERVWRSALRAWRAWWWRASQGGGVSSPLPPASDRKSTNHSFVLARRQCCSTICGCSLSMTTPRTGTSWTNGS